MPLNETVRRAELRDFLMNSRARIEPRDVGLPSHRRRRTAGLRQDDVAELVGVSTRWYESFESGKEEKRFSFEFVRRVGEALRLDETDRATLFRLSLPEVSDAIEATQRAAFRRSPPPLRRSSLTEDSELLLEAFGSFRGLVTRLWAATTEAEALTLVREHGTTQLKHDTMQTLTRGPGGLWSRVTTGDFGLAKRYDALAQGSSGGAFVDDLCCYTVMGQPGEVITRSQRDSINPGLAVKERPMLQAIGFPDLSFAMANIRSPLGFTARLLAVHHSAHAFTELEIAQLGTLADLASLALSGHVSSPQA
jgi:transcriptional regulator with XRE-family HTH domain